MSLAAFAFLLIFSGLAVGRKDVVGTAGAATHLTAPDLEGDFTARWGGTRFGTTSDFRELLDEAKAQQDWMRAIRRKIHEHPELKFEEHRTSQLIRDTLDDLGLRYVYPLADTGVVALIGASGDAAKRTVALRADMDALAVTEAVDSPYASRHPGRMHACGHDGHVAMLLLAARLLKAREASLVAAGVSVRLIFQPGEEGGAGALRMIQAGALGSAGAVFGLHVWPQLTTGTVGTRAGTLLAASGAFRVRVLGRGGHAAMPDEAIDPVVASAAIIQAVQTLVSREADPASEGAVVSITQVSTGRGGAHNVIPAKVKLGGTLRSLTATGFDRLQRRFTDVVVATAAAYRCNATVRFGPSPYPPTVNAPHATAFATDVARELLGGAAVTELQAPTMAAEDFSFYGRQVPACFLFLGIRPPGAVTAESLHSPRFVLDEDALPYGAALHAAIAMRYLLEDQAA